MTPAMRDYWMRILAAFFLLKMASTLVRDAEKMMAQSLRARDDAVAATLNGHSVAGGSFSVWPDADDVPSPAEDESPTEDESLEDEGEVINLNREDDDA